MFGLRAKHIFLISVFVASIFVASQYLPAYFSYYQLNDFIRQEVKYAASSRTTIEVLKKHIVDKAEELGIEIQAKEIQITSRGPSFTLELEYHWPIDLKVYQHELTFHASEQGESIEQRGRD